MLLAEKIKLIVALKRKGKERMVEKERKRRKGEEREGQDGREEGRKKIDARFSGVDCVVWTASCTDVVLLTCSLIMSLSRNWAPFLATN